MPPGRNSIDCELPPWANGSHAATGVIDPKVALCEFPPLRFAARDLLVIPQPGRRCGVVPHPPPPARLPTPVPQAPTAPRSARTGRARSGSRRAAPSAARAATGMGHGSLAGITAPANPSPRRSFPGSGPSTSARSRDHGRICSGSTLGGPLGRPLCSTPAAWPAGAQSRGLRAASTTRQSLQSRAIGAVGCSSHGCPEPSGSGERLRTLGSR